MVDNIYEAKDAPKWTLEAVKRVAARYTYIRDFRRDYHSAYKIAHRNGWLDQLDLIPFPASMRKPLKWDYEATKKEAAKYKTRAQFAKHSSGAYRAALHNGWLDEFGLERKPPCNLKWDYRTTKREAYKYSSRGEFQKKSTSAYMSAWRNGWLDEFFPA